MTITAATAALSPGPSSGSGLGATADDTETITWADFKQWERQLASTGICSHPIRLTGRIEAIDQATGEIAPVYDTASEPGGVLHVACGNRRESVCPACSAIYKRDARQLVRAGLAGGKGVPETITAHPCVFATFTAPSFGPVHSRRMRGKTVLPCRPRRDANARRCPHGRDISCATRHVEDDPRLGQPLCFDCYDYEAAVLFNAYAGDLWRRFTTYLPRQLARLAGVTQKELRAVLRIRYVKVAEYQERGIVHFHAVIRLDAPGQDYQPSPAGYTAVMLCDAIDQAASTATVTTGSGLRLGFGAQTDARAIRHSPRPARHRPGPIRAGGGELHRQVRHQDPYRARRPGHAHPHRLRSPGPALLPALPRDDHRRVAARRTGRDRGTAVPAMGAHARLRRPLPHQIPPLLRHLRSAPPSSN